MIYKSTNTEFQKKTPSVFVVCSPLQLLCAIEAEKEFEILNAIYVIILRHGWIRNEQLLSMAEFAHLNYISIFDDENVSWDTMMSKTEYYSNIDSCIKYNRIFIGDYFDTVLYRAAYKYAKEGTHIVYLDDGNASISLLSGKSDVPKPQVLRKRLFWFCRTKNEKILRRKEYVDFFKEKGIVCTNCFFTLFSDIRTSKFVLYPNNFTNLRNTYSSETGNEVILIVGPIFANIQDLYHIPEAEMEAIYWKKMSEVRTIYPDTDILFIPHGRDENRNLPTFCNLLGIKYTKILEAIEWFVVKSNIKPIAIYGQGSTALFTLKKMYPYANVVNWLLDKKNDNPIHYRDIRKSNYYKKHGIIEERIKFPSLSLNERCYTMIADLKSLMDWLKDKIKKYIHMIK